MTPVQHWGGRWPSLDHVDNGEDPIISAITSTVSTPIDVLPVASRDTAAWPTGNTATPPVVSSAVISPISSPNTLTSFPNWQSPAPQLAPLGHTARSASIGSATTEFGTGDETLGFSGALGLGTSLSLRGSNALLKSPRKKNEQNVVDTLCPGLSQGSSSKANEADPKPLLASLGRSPRKKREEVLEDIASPTVDQGSLSMMDEDRPKPLPAKQPRKQAKQVPEDAPCSNVDQTLLEVGSEEGLEPLLAGQGSPLTGKDGQALAGVSPLTVYPMLPQKDDEDVKFVFAVRYRLPRKKCEQELEDFSRITVVPILPKKETAEDWRGEENVRPLFSHQYRLPRKKCKGALDDLPYLDVEQGFLLLSANEANSKPLSANQGRSPRKMRGRMLEDVSCSNVNQTSPPKENGRFTTWRAEWGRLPRKGKQMVEDSLRLNIDPVPPIFVDQYKSPRKRPERVLEDPLLPNVDPALPSKAKGSLGSLPADQRGSPRKTVKQVPEDVPRPSVDQTKEDGGLKENGRGIVALRTKWGRLPRKKGEQTPEESSIVDLVSPETGNGYFKPLFGSQYRLPRKKCGEMLEDLPNVDPDHVPLRAEQVPEVTSPLTIDRLLSKIEDEEDMKSLFAQQYKLPRKRREQVLEDTSFPNIDQILPRNENGGHLGPLLAEQGNESEEHPKPRFTFQARLPRKKVGQVPDNTSLSNVYQRLPRKRNE